MNAFQHTITRSILAAVVWASLNITTIEAQDDAIQSNSSPEKASEKANVFRVESKFDDPNKVVTLDLGELICGTTISANVKLVNTLNEFLELPRRTFSCGCISGLPESLSIEAHGEANLPVRIDVAKRSEESFQNIAYWRSNGEPAIQLQFRYLSVLPVRFEREAIQVDSEEDQIVRVKFEPRSPDIDLSAIQLDAHAPELNSATVDRETKELILNLSPRNSLPYGLNSMVQLSVSVKESGSLSGKMRIEYPNRTIVTPSEATFRKSSEELQVVLTIQSKKLATQIAAGKKLIAAMLSGADRSKATTLSCKILNQRDSVIQVELSCPQLARSFDAIKLTCGSWTHQIPSRVEN